MHIPQDVRYVQLGFACMQMWSMYKCEEEAYLTASDWLEVSTITPLQYVWIGMTTIEMQTHKVVEKKLNWRELKNLFQEHISPICSSAAVLANIINRVT